MDFITSTGNNMLAIITISAGWNWKWESTAETEHVFEWFGQVWRQRGALNSPDMAKKIENQN